MKQKKTGRPPIKPIRRVMSMEERTSISSPFPKIGIRVKLNSNGRPSTGVTRIAYASSQPVGISQLKIDCKRAKSSAKDKRYVVATGDIFVIPTYEFGRPHANDLKINPPNNALFFRVTSFTKRGTPHLCVIKTFRTARGTCGPDSRTILSREFPACFAFSSMIKHKTEGVDREIERAFCRPHDILLSIPTMYSPIDSSSDSSFVRLYTRKLCRHSAAKWNGRAVPLYVPKEESSDESSDESSNEK